MFGVYRYIIQNHHGFDVWNAGWTMNESPLNFWLTCDIQYCHRSLHSFRTCLLPQVLFTSTMANSPVLVPVKNSVSTTETVSCHRIFISDTLMCRFFVPIRLDPGEIKGAWGPMPVPNDSSKTQHNENRTGYHQIVKIISDSWEISAPIRPLSSCDVAFLCSKSRNHFSSENILLGNCEGPASAQPSCHFSSGPVSEFLKGLNRQFGNYIFRKFTRMDRSWARRLTDTTLKFL